ncbi:hypothetical protein [Enterobacter sp. KBR-315C3_2022]|uniref:hypothetical protein n=1 Tax=Enterobacter sp. KBR-315C3_2022 TaxID=3242494 RepID=UPI0035272682
MKKKFSKWPLAFLYLIVSLPIGIFISVTVTQILMNVFYFFTDGIDLNLSSIDYFKIFKGSVIGGVIGAIGCWYIYYRNYRKQ